MVEVAQNKRRGVTSHRQPQQCRGSKTAKGAQSDPNFFNSSQYRISCLLTNKINAFANVVIM